MNKKDLWAVWINGYGFRFDKPTLVKYDEETNSWWNKTGNEDVKKVGLELNDSGTVITFSSYNKRDVKLFILGMKAMKTVMCNGIMYGSLIKKSIARI